MSYSKPTFATFHNLLFFRRGLCVFVLAAILIGLFSGCTSQQLYNTGQAYQRNQCLHLPDQGEREKCLNYTSTTYENYKREINSTTEN